MNEEEKALFKVFSDYDSSLVAWAHVFDVFGADSAEEQAAEQLVREARQRLIRAVRSLND